MPRPHVRRLWLLPGVIAFAALAVHAHRARTDLATGAAWPGPDAAMLERAADGRLDRGLLALQDRELPVAERLAEYRRALERAEPLLVDSLLAQPTRADALAKLAAVRWEREPQRDEPSMRLVELSSRLAQRDPVVQERLAEFLLRIGRNDDALRYVRRALELDPERARPAVALLTQNGMAPADVLREIGPSAAILSAVRPAFLSLGQERAWLDAVDSAEEPLAASAGTLVAYADSCLRTRAPERLRDALDRLGPLPDPALESQRLRQRARASLALGQPEAAEADARAAVERAPESAHARESLGDVMAASGDHDAAVEAFRTALERAARGANRPRLRGRLYGKIGRSEEALGRTDPALDAYRLALRLDPDQPIARRRLDALAGTILAPPAAGRLRASEGTH